MHFSDGRLRLPPRLRAWSRAVDDAIVQRRSTRAAPAHASGHERSRTHRAVRGEKRAIGIGRPRVRGRRRRRRRLRWARRCTAERRPGLIFGLWGVLGAVSTPLVGEAGRKKPGADRAWHVRFLRHSANAVPDEASAPTYACPLERERARRPMCTRPRRGERVRTGKPERARRRRRAGRGGAAYMLAPRRRARHVGAEPLADDALALRRRRQGRPDLRG